MTFLLGCLGWALLIAGALPEPGRKWLEERVPWWDGRWASIVSAALEGYLGVTLLQRLLIRTGIEDAPPAGGVWWGLAGLFLTIEGLLRAVAAITQHTGVASLPIHILWRAWASIRGRR
jgi:hypothetical protein